MQATRPRLLLVPSISELEWAKVRPLLEEWADVASYDLPGFGEEGSAGRLDLDMSISRGVGELERRKWSEAVIVGDQFGSGLAVLVASAWQGRIRGLALGHACLNYRRDGPRPAISVAVADFQLQLARAGFRAAEQMFVQGLEVTYGAEVAARIRARLTPEFMREFAEFLLSHEHIDLEPDLRALGVPLLLVEHRDCPLWTAEGYEDAVAAFPSAQAAQTGDNPASSSEFAAALRAFAETVWPAR
jgi:hypothetical protein